MGLGNGYSRREAAELTVRDERKKKVNRMG